MLHARGFCEETSAVHVIFLTFTTQLRIKAHLRKQTQNIKKACGDMSR